MMKRKLVFATNNAHKLEEVAAILGDQVELLSLNDISCQTDIPETAETLEGNALLKSSYIYKNYHLDCFADDTGLVDGKEYLFEGVIKGEIIKEKRGDSGFGYDPIFKPEGYDRTFAELGNDIKNQISHRALAVQKLCEFLQS